ASVSSMRASVAMCITMARSMFMPSHYITYNEREPPRRQERQGMELILIKSPQTTEEETFHLKFGTNSLGSSNASDVSVAESGILPHHLNIEYTKDSLILSAINPASGFTFQGKDCRRAVIRPGEMFSIENTPFFCYATAGSDKTEHASI